MPAPQELELASLKPLEKELSCLESLNANEPTTSGSHLNSFLIDLETLSLRPPLNHLIDLYITQGDMSWQRNLTILSFYHSSI